MKATEKRRNLILADCDFTEIKRFVDGIKSINNQEFEVKCQIANKSRAKKINNIKRYISYFLFPVKTFLRRKKYDKVIGWQQFYALNFANYCRIFHVKKQNYLVAWNYTYKEKKGIIGKIYKRYMKKIMQSKYIDLVHVPSKEYIKICSEQLECSEEKFFFNYFAIDDIYEEKELQSPVDYEYSLSIGRSNRDFDFLIKNFPSTEKLIIISDTYVCNEELPKNIVLLNNVSGNSQYKYFNNAKSIIIPIADGTIPSGDTVLLTSMMFSKPIIITKPSTLAEVYVDNMHNGFTLEKNENFKANLKEILSDDKKLAEIGKNARDDFLKKYSREAMGRNLGKLIK